VRPTHLSVAASLLVLAACAGGGRGAGGPAPSGIAAAQPSAAVEQFLGFVNQGRFTEMGYLFGTRRGPIAEQQAPLRVARQMQALASVLRHDEFALTAVLPEPGRPEARRINVDLRRGGAFYDVPFVVVQGPGGRWLVEVVDMDAAQQPRPRR
jgi:hypothetical protein